MHHVSESLEAEAKMTLDAVYDSDLHQYRCDETQHYVGLAMTSGPLDGASFRDSADASALREVIAQIRDGWPFVDVAARSGLAQRSAKRVEWRASLDLGDRKSVV